MSGYKTDQRRLVHRGKEFHFVSYEGLAANPRRSQEATLPMWCLMRAGKRWTVMEQNPEQTEAELDLQLQRWLDLNVFGGTKAPAMRRQA